MIIPNNRIIESIYSFLKKLFQARGMKYSSLRMIFRRRRPFRHLIEDIKERIEEREREREEMRNGHCHHHINMHTHTEAMIASIVLSQQ